MHLKCNFNYITMNIVDNVKKVLFGLSLMCYILKIPK